MSRWDGDRYAKSKNVRIAEMKQLFEWSGYKFTGKENVLDIGCANGMVVDHLCNEHPNIKMTAIDNDQNMISYAKEKYSRPDHLKFIQIAAQDLNFSSEFDLIISTACLHWVKDQKKALSGIYNSAVPGANVLIKLYMKQPYLWEALEVIMSTPSWSNFFENFENPYYFYDDKTYRDLAKRSNLNIKNIAMIESENTLKSTQIAHDVFASWLPHLSRLPEALHSNFISEICDQMLIKMKADGMSGFNEYRAPALYVHLVK